MRWLKILLIGAMITVGLGTAHAGQWKVDPVHSKITFGVRHLIISEVTGYFGSFQGTVVNPGDDFTDSQVEFTIDVNSINTDNPKRDSDLKSEGFFDVANYPTIHFKSTAFKKVSEGHYEMTGDFTIKDVTRNITLDVEHGGTITDPWGNQRAGFRITSSINRFDYHLTWNKLMETGGAIVGDTVNITCNVEIILQK